MTLPHPLTVLHFATDKVVFTVDGFRRSCQDAFQRLTSHSFYLPALIFFRMGNLSELEYRGHKVPNIGKGVHLPTTFDFGARYEQRTADATFPVASACCSMKLLLKRLRA